MLKLVSGGNNNIVMDWICMGVPPKTESGSNCWWNSSPSSPEAFYTTKQGVNDDVRFQTIQVYRSLHCHCPTNFLSKESFRKCSHEIVVEAQALDQAVLPVRQDDLC